MTPDSRWTLRIEDGPVIGGFTSREAGNLYYPTGTPQEVAANRQRVLADLGLARGPLVEAQQVHGNAVYRVTAKLLPELKQEDGRFIAPQADALVTTAPGIVLSTYHADCVPVFLWLPDGAGIGLMHAGWRGTLADVAGNAVHELVQAAGAIPENMRAVIGPAICADCYEVGPEVAEAAARLPAAEGFLSKISNRWHLDLKGINQCQLEEAGLVTDNIEVSEVCTHCRPDLLFSYRRLGPGCPEMAAFMAIRPAR